MDHKTSFPLGLLRGCRLETTVAGSRAPDEPRFCDDDATGAVGSSAMVLLELFVLLDCFLFCFY